mgnify:CR=1 FL=1
MTIREELAAAMFPDITRTPEEYEALYPPRSLPEGARLSFVNANDGTCEGIDYPDLQAFSVQFHPEACSGPHDTAFLFDRFCDLMGGAHHAD